MPRKPGSPKRLPTTIPTSRRSLTAYDKSLKALELRRDGLTWRQIAVEMGYKSPATAHEAVQRLLKRSVQETDDEMRAIEAERLDKYQKKLDELVFDEGASPRMAARNIEVAVGKVMQRRAELFGLDAANRTELTIQAPKVIEYVRDERQDDRGRAVQEVLEADYEELEDLEQRHRDTEQRKSLPDPGREGEAPGSADPGDAE